MSLASFFASERISRGASLLIAALVLVSCERAKSPAATDTAAAKPRSSDKAAPESSPEDMRAFAAAHLPSGWKPGDFLTKKNDYPTGDTADVYRAVLDTLYTRKDGAPGEVILNAYAPAGFVTVLQRPGRV